ncbi:MAG: GNAT family N-acetyltransferase [Candidatus Aquicultor sp.]
MSIYLTPLDGSLIVRPCRPTDAEPVYEAVCESIRELSPWMPWCHRGYSIEDSRTWLGSRPDTWQRGMEYDFLIADRSDGRPLGICGLNNLDRENRLANLGYWIRTSSARQGVASAGIPLVIRFGFEELNLNRIEIIVATGNIPSQGLATKIGACREGRLRKRLIVRDRVYDAIMFSLIPEDLNL